MFPSPLLISVLLYLKKYYRSVCVSKCLLNYWQQIWKTKCNVVTNFISVQVKNDMTCCHQLFTEFSRIIKRSKINVFNFQYVNSIHIFCTFIDMFSINIMSVFFNTFVAYLLNTYLIAAREEFQILKNGSDYRGAWPPLYYTKKRGSKSH